jgi:hypothetical protein
MKAKKGKALKRGKKLSATKTLAARRLARAKFARAEAVELGRANREAEGTA